FVKTFYNQSQLVVFNDIQLITETPNGCKDTAVQRVEVNPFVEADFVSDSVGCSPLRVDFREFSIGAQTYEWRFGDGGFSPQNNPRHFYINSGQSDTTFTATLKVTSARGCVDSLEKDITVFPKPTADFLTNLNNGCQPLPVDFTNQSQLADSCVWIFGDGNRTSSCGQLITHTYTNELSIVPLSYEAELIVYTNQGCSDTLSRNITVNPQVIADFSADTVGCSPLESTFRAQSFGASNFFWDFGDGRQATGLVATNNYSNTGSVDSTYRAQLIAQSIYQCNDTAYQNILVRPTPIPDFVANPTFQVYPNATVNLTNTTNAGNWDFDWDFDDSITSTLREPGTHTYNTWGQYWIKLVASTPFCSDSVRKLVEIDVPVPVADFRDSASGCEPLEVNFENESQYGASYEWDFGDGNTSNVENPRHVYYEAGTYDVRLRVQGYAPNKEDTETKVSYIHVFKSPQAGFLPNKETVYIPDDPLVLSNISKDADFYEWNFGDGNTSTKQSPVHYYQEEGEFDIYLVASSNNGCRDTFYLPTKIIGELDGRIEVPNAFTPNPNGGNGGVFDRGNNPARLNDVFYAKVRGAAKYELNIFNKWGELLFVSKDVNIGWDGYYKDELCQQDVYVWKIKAEFIDGKTVVKVGDLMLLR
ncbi:MAG: PKD domain-containing protein, partial [Vicingaceae bacterium]